MPKYDLRERSKHLIAARKWGMGAITSIFGLGIFVAELNRIRQLPIDIANLAYLMLFVVIGTLIFIWIWSTERELNLLFEWMNPQRYVPPNDLKETFTIVGIGILLGGLFYTSRNPIAFGVVFASYSIVVLFAVRHFNKELIVIISESRRRINELKNQKAQTAPEMLQLYLKGISVLEEYFIKNPHTPRHLITLFFSSIGLLVAILPHISEISVPGFIAYFVFVFTIIISEIVIWRWRNAREAKLRPFTAELNEIRRKIENRENNNRDYF